MLIPLVLVRVQVGKNAELVESLDQLLGSPELVANFGPKEFKSQERKVDSSCSSISPAPSNASVAFLQEEMLLHCGSFQAPSPAESCALKRRNHCPLPLSCAVWVWRN